LRWIARAVIALFFILFLPLVPHAQEEYKVDLGEIEKEIESKSKAPFSLNGFLEFEPKLFGADPDTALYRLKFFDQNEGETFEEYPFSSRLEGTYTRGDLSVFFRGNAEVKSSNDGFEETTKLLEGFASYKHNANLSFDAGKKLVRWGKGYAWNPVNFIGRNRDPEDPEEALEGFILFRADAVRSFSGPMKTANLSAVALPVYDNFNDDFGKEDHVNFASKLYLLLWDTDIDFLYFGGASRTTRFGFDFSKNLLTNLEIHGEWAYVSNFEKGAVDSQGRFSRQEYDAINYLIGLRYLTEQETTFILEYYHNGQGFTQEELKRFFDFADTSYENFTRTSQDGGLQRGRTLLKSAFGRPNPGRDYIYFRASQKEPFGILFLTPAVTSILNLSDKSFVLIPEVTYSLRQNIELRGRVAGLFGSKDTEYGEKRNEYRFELRIRYFF
jgi:hypothetical protein